METARTINKKSSGTKNKSIPLCVDLDGTLINNDLLIESIFMLIKKDPISIFFILFWRLKGKAYLKYMVEKKISLNFESLPYNEKVIRFLQRQHKKGRPLILVTGSTAGFAQGVFNYLGIFDKYYASTKKINLSGKNKASFLSKTFGEFDYIGNSSNDLPVWKKSRYAILINASPIVALRAKKIANIKGYSSDIKLRYIFKEMRPHQWAKNLLLFAPMFLADKFNLMLIYQATLAFISFSLCASAVYIFNDLIDLHSDRIHETKKLRPLASGKVPLNFGIFTAFVSLAVSILISFFLPFSFTVLLLGYFVLTTAYSLELKQILVADVVTLAALYTWRLFAGAVATGVDVSSWLFAFSGFFFLSLAMIKRSSELLSHLELGKKELSGRSYITRDINQLGSLGSASGFMAVLVLALYINNETAFQFYPKPQFLWIICPLLVYWISRYWLIANRGKMDHDPVLFVVKDKVSYFIITAMAISWLLAKGLF